MVDPLGTWCVWQDGSGHDDDVEDGGADEDECARQGGVWDPTDTIFASFGDLTLSISIVAVEPAILDPTPGPGSITQLPGADPEDVAVGIDIWHDSPACQDCGTIWRSTAGGMNQITAGVATVWTLGASAPLTISAAATLIGASHAALGTGGAFVVGLYPAYIEAADAEGMGAFNLPADLYNALQSQGVAWFAVQSYITTQVLLGRAVFLAGPAVTNSTTTLSLELDHLIQIGSGPSSWTLLHAPFL